MTCEFCGSVTAQRIKLNSSSSRVLWWVHHKTFNTLCGSCAENAYLSHQSRNLTMGWWGPISAIATFVFIPLNAVRIAIHRRAIPKVFVYGTQQMRFKRRAWDKPLNVIVPLIIFGAFVYLVATSPSSSTDYPASTISTPSSSGGYVVGTCWMDTTDNMVTEVACSNSMAQYRTTFVVTESSQCPGEYLDPKQGKFACLENW